MAYVCSSPEEDLAEVLNYKNAPNTDESTQVSYSILNFMSDG